LTIAPGDLQGPKGNVNPCHATLRQSVRQANGEVATASPDIQNLYGVLWLCLLPLVHKTHPVLN
jgi:hypothetical protein